jgi:AraC-like DNA-binding protein
MRDQPSCPSPTTRIDLPIAAAASFVRAFITRDSRHCDLRGDQELNRFPASSYCVITWFLDGSVDLVSCAGQQHHTRLARCAVSGCQTQPFTSRNRGEVRGFIAMFYPDAFHALFGIDLASLKNRFADARQILPPHGLELVEAVFQARSDSERRQLVERFILRHTQSVTIPAWTRMRRMGNRMTLKMASAILGIGPRQLQRVALREAGLNLQTLARLLRGERSYLSAQRLHLSGKQLDWADHAIASDFADQSHMARECKAQTGRTPAQLARDVQCEEADWIYRLEFPTDEDCPTTRSA